MAGDRAGQHSIRINRQWSICFRWSGAGPGDVEIVDDLEVEKDRLGAALDDIRA